MYRLFGGAALVGAIWALIAPWLPLDQAAAAGHMTGMTGMGAAAGSMVAPTDGTTLFGVVLTPSIYFWHIVPGVIGIVAATWLLVAGSTTLRRMSATGLLAVGVWVAFGPWVLPALGLGDTMTMGLTTGSLVRHAGPGLLIVLAAIGCLRTLPRAAAAAIEAATPASADGH